jgi:signal transduction histidine kinase/FixJ family two-component response regulator
MWDTLTAGKVWRNEIYNRRKDGSCYWESATISPVKNEAGRITHYVAVKEDISLRKQAEIERQEHYDRLVTFMETLPDAVVLKDGQGRWLLTNQVAKIRFQLEDYPWQGKTDIQLATERPEFRTVHEACANSDELAWETAGGVVDYEEMTGPDNQQQILEVRKMPIFDEHCQRKALVIIGRDITARKIAEQEQEKLTRQLHQAKKMESIGLMAGGVAHDLNNILSGIVGYPELILQGLPLDSKLRKPINAILRSGKNAAVVVADLLTVARGAAGIREVHDLNILVREYLDSPECVQLRSLHQEVTFQEQCGAETAMVLCSPVHVKKCLMNLVVNGAESIVGKGQVSVTTSNECLDKKQAEIIKVQAGEYVVLHVRDSGSGIEEKDLEHIFEPFYTRKVMGRSGTGLGLAVVWNTMEDHNGKVVVDSSGSGTCFKLYFPLTERRAAVPNDSAAAEDLNGNNEHILIVDDESYLQELGCEMLEVLGYQVDAVASGEEAIEFVRKRPVDLLVLDMMMDPGMNGRQAYQEILRLYPEQRAIVVSGFSESEDVKETLQLGASCFIRKPYLLDQLGRAVRDALVGQCYPGSTMQRNQAMRAVLKKSRP